jgi:hypothetical protein
LAAHLRTLAELYGRDDVRAVIEHQKGFFRADADKAVRLAGLLSVARGVCKEGMARRKAERTRRAVALLVKAYEAHARGGRWRSWSRRTKRTPAAGASCSSGSKPSANRLPRRAPPRAAWRGQSTPL